MSNSDRLESALKESNPFAAARALATQLRDSGMSQGDLHK